MSIALWVARILLATVFTLAGLTKLSHSPQELLGLMPAFASLPPPLFAGIALAELLGAVGLIVPPLVQRAPWLSRLSAGALAIGLLGALPLHLTHGELAILPLNLLLFAVALFIGSGQEDPTPAARYKPAPLLP